MQKYIKHILFFLSPNDTSVQGGFNGSSLLAVAHEKLQLGLKIPAGLYYDHCVGKENNKKTKRTKIKKRKDEMVKKDRRRKTDERKNQ